MHWSRMQGWMQRRGKRSGKRSPACLIRRDLLAFDRSGDVESESAFVVGFDSGGEVEIGEGDLLGVLAEAPEGLADDGVVMDFLLVLIVEDQQGWGLWKSLLAWRRGGAGVNIPVAIGLFLTKHPLFFCLLRQTLLVHLVGLGEIILVILVIGRVRIPPPVGIVESAVVGIVIAAAGVAPAITGSVGAKARAAEIVMQEGAVGPAALRETALSECRAVGETAGYTWTGVNRAGAHSAGSVSA